MTRSLLLALFVAGAVQAQYYVEFPQDGTDINLLITLSLMDPVCQGIMFNADHDGEIVLDASYLTTWPQIFGRELRSSNGSRIATRLVLQDYTQAAFDQPLIVAGGKIGEFLIEPALVPEHEPICDVVNYPVRFENVEFIRSAEVLGDPWQPCYLDEDNVHLRISGHSQSAVVSSTSGFDHFVTNTVDIVDCEFIVGNEIAGGCDLQDYNKELIQCSGGRLRISNPVISGVYASLHFTQAPILATSSMVHIEDAVLDNIVGVQDAGLLNAWGAGDAIGLPNIYYGNCTVSLLSGGSAGVGKHQNAGIAKVSNSTFSFNGNNVTSNPLGLSVDTGVFEFNNCSQVEIANSQFTTNEGIYTGVMAVSTANTPQGQRGLHVHGEDTVFSTNRCSGFGVGALRVSGADNIYIDDATFDHNWTVSFNPMEMTAHHLLIHSCELDAASPFEEYGIYNCSFDGGSNQFNSAVEGAVVFNNSDALIRECAFTDFYSNHALFASLTSGNLLEISGNVFNQPNIGVRVVGAGNEDCRIWNNLFKDAILHAISPGLSVNESFPTGPALWVDGNTMLNSGMASLHFDDMTVSAEVCNNLFWRATQDIEIDYAPPFDPPIAIHHNNLNGGLSAIDYPSAILDPATTWSETPTLVEMDELKWDSILFDRGTATGGGFDEGYDYDFDLTSRDIGWHVPREVVEITGSVTGLDSKWYKADGLVSIDAGPAGVPPGAVIRAETGTQLYLYTYNQATLAIGDDAGTRTAIVGRPDPLLEPAGMIQLGGDLMSSSTLSAQGLLFNYAASNTAAAGMPPAIPALDFADLDLQELNGHLATAINTVEFQNYDNAILTFTNCEGRIRNWDFSETVANDGMPDMMGMVNSLVHVEHVDFQATGPYHPFSLKIVGAYQGGTEALVAHSDFPHAETGLSPLQVKQAFVRLEENTVNCEEAAGISHFQSALYMQEDAGNTFSRVVSNPAPLIDSESGFINLFCGGNAFIWPSTGPSEPAIDYDTSNPMPAGVPAWSYNYWGSTCTSADYPETFVNGNDLVPDYAWVTDILPSCTAEPPAGCELNLSDPAWLLSEGKLAEQGDFRHVAHEYYRLILHEHETSKEVVEAVARLKVVGQKGDYGADFYTYVRDDLFTASTISELAGRHLDAVQAECNGWLVEAWTGDCSAAKAGLAAMLVGETDPKCINVINAAEKERSGYSNCGRLLAAGDTALLAVPMQRARVTKQLLFEGDVQVADEASATLQPTEFKIEACYPNPFNPVTQVRFFMPSKGHALVRVFNLQGQLVATLHDEAVESGTHTVHFDGSHLASGLYLIEAGNRETRDVQKVMLVK
jgi:flagellin-like hook-associated protein FlgL